MLVVIMDSQLRTGTKPGRAASAADERSASRSGARLRGLLAGGTEGNERLTVLTGLLLIILVAALGITIVRIGQLLWLHFFLGLMLIGPVALKMASTGYRFVRYYTANPRYQAKGPPAPLLRMMAPVVVALTITVFATGVLLLFIGPTSSSRSTITLLHKASFIAWIALTAVHVLGHLPEIVGLLRVSRESRAELIAARSPRARRVTAHAGPTINPRLPGGAGRWLSLGTALVAGLILAIVLIPDFGTWTSSHFVFHHHHFH